MRTAAVAERALPTRADLPSSGSAVHLMGLGGAGMRGLAALMAWEGYRVSGCDRNRTTGGVDLEGASVTFLPGHDPAHVRDVALLVYSAAVPEGHTEVAAARELGIPTLKRARALGAMVNGSRLVGVSGTHGKTTIAAMIAIACRAARLDPSAAVGGRVAAWGGYARRGAGDLAVVEADEFDRSFLELDPHLAVVSSVEPEHLDSYGNLAALSDAFVTFATRAVGRCGVLACADDPGARETAARVSGALTYGLGAEADFRVEALGPGEAAQRCRLHAPTGTLDFALGVPGEHNVCNAGAALGAAILLGADPDPLREALATFRGVERRLELLAERADVAIVDDYAHHPTEVRASLAALRQGYPDRRLIVVFQPHLYSRTLALAADFAEALGAADAAHVLPIYPAREEPISGVTSELIVEAAPAHVRPVTWEEALEVVRRATGTPTALVFMGAGDVTELARQAARELGADALGV